MPRDILTKPSWASDNDHEEDVTDIWQKETDPENEDGEVCTGHFKAEDAPCIDGQHRCFTGTQHVLLGLSVESDGVTVFYDRETAMELLGSEAVWRMQGDPQ